MHPFYKRLGQRLREQRHAKGLTQQELAERAGLTTAFLSYLENGSRKGSLDSYLALGNTLGLEPEALFGSDAGARTASASRYGESLISLEGLSSYDTRSVQSVVRSLRRKGKKKA
jgi:transcriptional regulator with XRE-family HTH domain